MFSLVYLYIIVIKNRRRRQINFTRQVVRVVGRCLDFIGLRQIAQTSQSLPPLPPEEEDEQHECVGEEILLGRNWSWLVGDVLADLDGVRKTERNKSAATGRENDDERLRTIFEEDCGVCCTCEPDADKHLTTIGEDRAVSTVVIVSCWVLKEIASVVVVSKTVSSVELPKLINSIVRTQKWLDGRVWTMVNKY